MRGSLWPGKSDVAHLSRLACFEGRLQPALLEHPVRIVVVDDLVKLPQVDPVGAEPAQAVVEALHRARMIALAVLGHEEHLVAPAVRQRASHDLLGAAIVVIPAVVEEGDAFVDGGVHDADGLARILHGADVPSAEAEDRDALARPPQHARRQSARSRRLLAGEDILARAPTANADAAASNRNSRRVVVDSVLMTVLRAATQSIHSHEPHKLHPRGCAPRAPLHALLRGPRARSVRVAHCSARSLLQGGSSNRLFVPTAQLFGVPSPVHHDRRCGAVERSLTQFASFPPDSKSKSETGAPSSCFARIREVSVRSAVGYSGGMVSSQLGRNDPCHCGSGRKYKQCCLGKDEHAARARARRLPRRRRRLSQPTPRRPRPRHLEPISPGKNP